MNQLTKEANILDHYKTFAVYTLGCKVNLYESEIIINQLRSIGLIEVDFKHKADIYIINTCSVTNVADHKSKNIINRASKNNPNALIIVCGCYSQNYVNEIKQSLHADIVIGNKYKNNLINLIDAYIHNEKKQIVNVENLMLENQIEFSFLNDFVHKTRAFIKIQDGCNFMCSYCSIPFSRGKQRCVPFVDLIQNINNLIDNGYKEIVLTGVNTAGYCDNQKTFYDLLKAINEIKGDFRVRISSIEPFQITDEIINLVCNNPKRFCKHWHICLQSGNDETLKLMNRKYTCNDFYQLINKIYEIQPLCSISTDVIVGFPFEDDTYFQNSLNFIKKCHFSFLHVFPYSKRKFTPAATMNNQVSSIDKKNRVKLMLDLSQTLKNEYLKKFINQKVEVLWEKKDKNFIYGKTSEYCDVISSDVNKYEINTINELSVKRIFNSKLIV